MKHLIGVLVAVLLTVFLLYISRFWIWQAPWSNDGLFEIKQLAPRGDVVRKLVRGTQLNVFDVLVWFAFSIALLSALQWFHKLFRR